MTDEKKVTEAEKLLYSLSAIKDILKMLECDVEVTMTLKNNHTETFDCYKEIEKCVVDYVKSTKPYKFENLKADMYLYDVKKNEIIYLFKPLNWEPIFGLRYSYEKIDHSAYGYYMDFEENRFFPVQMANMR